MSDLDSVTGKGNLQATLNGVVFFKLNFLGLKKIHVKY